MSFAEYQDDATPTPAPSTAASAHAAPSKDDALSQAASDTASEAAAQISEMAERTKAQIDGSLEDLQRVGDELSTEVTRALSSATEEGTRFVRDHPGAALAGAVGVGVLVGLALRPRS